MNAMREPGQALLAVVVPVKDPDPERLRRCLASFDALAHASEVRLVLVFTGAFDRAALSGFDRFHSIALLPCQVSGIYNACNVGIEAAQARFLLFFGHDDIALPEMDEVIELLVATSVERVLVAAAVYVQGLGIRRPSWLRQGILFRNWGHQGLFYASELLHRDSYDTRFPLRADHRLNIALLADPRVHCLRLPHVVCYFARGGYSSRHIVDPNFDREQATIASAEFGLTWGLAVRGLLPLVRLLRRAARALRRRFTSITPRNRNESW